MKKQNIISLVMLALFVITLFLNLKISLGKGNVFLKLDSVNKVEYSKSNGPILYFPTMESIKGTCVECSCGIELWCKCTVYIMGCDVNPEGWPDCDYGIEEGESTTDCTVQGSC